MKKIYLFVTMLLLAAIAIPVEAATKWTAYRIMLDPGHGGTDPGASGPSAPHEATLALRCGLALKKRIVDECGGTVKMTRETDVFISLTARREASVSYDPYIFCSIHLNAFNNTAKGTETYYYWSTGNSYMLAQKVQARLIEQFKTVSGFTPTNRGVKYGNLAVIKGSSSVPAILTEGLFVDNSTEWSIINSESKDGFKKWVQGHLYGFYDRFVLLNSGIIDPSSASTTVTPDPTMTVNPTSMSFSCVAGETRTNQVAVTGANLTATVSASISGSAFSISAQSLSTTGGYVTVKFAPTVAGSYTGTLTLTSGSVTKNVTLTGTATAPALTFTEGWNFSDAKNTLTSAGWDAGKVRNMTYNAGKLYLVYNHSDIKVVNAQTGADLGNLNKSGVAGGVLTLCDVKYCDGKIVACNLANTEKNELRVYVWDDDQENPRLLLSTTELGGANRIGDCIGFYGTWASGKLVFGSDDGTTNRIIEYAITDGVCATTPTVINVTTDGTTRLASASSTRVYPDADGYWIDGKDNYTTRLGLDGKREYYIDSDVNWGNAFEPFTWQGVQYALTMTYNPMQGESWSTQTDEQKALNYTAGRMKLLQKEDGTEWTEAVDCGDYPSETVSDTDFTAVGLSSTVQNTNCTGNVIVAVNGTTGVEAWVLSTSQGIAYYKYGTTPTNEVEEIVPIVPVVSVDKTSVSLAAKPNETATSVVKVTGADLLGDVTIEVSGDSDVISVSETAIAQASAAEGVEITVTYTPLAVGTHEAVLTITSSGAETKTVTVSGTCTNTYLEDNITELTEVWNYSGNSTATQPSWLNLTSAESTRFIAFNDGKLYVLNCSPWGTPEVNILDAYTGEDTGENVNLEGVSGGLTALSSISFVDGVLVGANASNANHTFTVYAWKDGVATAPTKILEDAAHGGLVMGSNVTISGNLTNGRIWATDDACNNVLYYAITGGVVNTAPEVLALTDASGNAISLAGSRGASPVIPNEDGTFWVDGKDKYPILFDATGKQTATMQTGAFNNNPHGTALKFFDYGEKKYAAAVAYGFGDDGKTTQTNGYFTLIDVTDGATSASSYVAKYPADGLGSTANDQNMSSICQSTRENGDILDIWVCCVRQGVAHYSYNGRKTIDNTTVGVEDVAAKAEVKVWVADGMLNMAGVEVAEVCVYAVSGSLVANAKDAQQVSVAGLPAGIYIVAIADVDGNMYTAKIANK